MDSTNKFDRFVTKVFVKLTSQLSANVLIIIVGLIFGILTNLYTNYDKVANHYFGGILLIIVIVMILHVINRQSFFSGRLESAIHNKIVFEEEPISNYKVFRDNFYTDIEFKEKRRYLLLILLIFALLLYSVVLIESANREYTKELQKNEGYIEKTLNIQNQKLDDLLKRINKMNHKIGDTLLDSTNRVGGRAETTQLNTNITTNSKKHT